LAFLLSMAFLSWGALIVIVVLFSTILPPSPPLVIAHDLSPPLYPSSFVHTRCLFCCPFSLVYVALVLFVDFLMYLTITSAVSLSLCLSCSLGPSCCSSHTHSLPPHFTRLNSHFLFISIFRSNISFLSLPFLFPFVVYLPPFLFPCLSLCTTHWIWIRMLVAARRTISLFFFVKNKQITPSFFTFHFSLSLFFPPFCLSLFLFSSP
jgi:hypothetical protein